MNPSEMNPSDDLDLEKVRSLTRKHDAAEFLKTEEHMAALLEAALEDGSPKVIAAAMDAIARARRMAKE